MKKYQFMVILLLVLALSVMAFPADEKVPITAKSSEALTSYLKARALSEKLRGQESIEFYKKAVELDPDFAMAYLNLAFVQPTAREFFESLNKAKSLTDKVSEGERLWILGSNAGVNGFPMKQREYFQKLVKMYPGDERTHNLLGNHYFGQQEYDKAIEEYEKAIDINPEFSQPYNQLGYSYRFLGKYDPAEKTFKKYIELIPDDPNPYDSYAELLMKMGKAESSIEQYRKALSVNPNFVASHIGIATNLNFLGKHEEARKELERLYEMARNDGERRAALFATTVSYVDEGNTEDALKTMKKQYAMGEKINDSAAMAGDLQTMANIYYESGNYSKASDLFQKANQIIQESDHKQEIKDNAARILLYNEARVALMMGNLDLARQKAMEFSKAAKKVSNTFQIWLSHQADGMIAMHEKNYDMAIAEFKQANQQNPYVIYQLSQAYSAKGDNENTRAVCEKAAGHNTLNNMQYAFIRTKAKKMLTSL